MNAEQKAKAIACIEGAKRIGAYSAFTSNGNPCCSIGHLLACAGVRGPEARKRELEPKDWLASFPELKEVYGLDYEHLSPIMFRNDDNKGQARRRAVLSYLSSIEVDS